MEPMNGKAVHRAVAYALKATPKDEKKAALQHVTFFGNRVVGADGERWHIGYLPGSMDRPMAVARVSAENLVRLLTFAGQWANRRQGTFSVSFDRADVTVECGLATPIRYNMTEIDVGKFPPAFIEPVAVDAPLNPDGLRHVGCGHLNAATQWWRSWDKDYGTSEIRGGQNQTPIRLDVISGGDIVATAFVLGADRPKAEFREPGQTSLLDKRAPTYGRSNLELDLSGDGKPDPQKQTIDLNGVKLDATGILDVELKDLIVDGPCAHREVDGPCVPCTEAKIAMVKKAQITLAEKEARKQKKAAASADQAHP